MFTCTKILLFHGLTNIHPDIFSYRKEQECDFRERQEEKTGQKNGQAHQKKPTCPFTKMHLSVLQGEQVHLFF